jgi:CubicO group peptidase (beta-lactamase class C family)
VDKSSGNPFEDYLMEELFKPLGMESTGHLGFHESDQPAVGYEFLNGNLASTGEMDPTYFRGSGGVFANVRDLYRFYQALYEEDFLSDRSMQMYGVGRHFGSIWGFRSGFEPMPSRGIVVIVLSNFFHTPIEDIMAEIMNILLEGDIIRQPVKEPAAYVGSFQAPDFDRIEREVRVELQTKGLRLRILDSSGDVLEMTLHPWVKDRFLTRIDSRLAGVLVTFDRDPADRVTGVTLDLYGWRIHAQRKED